MLRLHQKTHRFFIEPLTGTKHIVFDLYKRFVTFTQKLASSEKAPLRTLFNRVKKDCQSTIGCNLRNLMLRYNVNSQEEINSNVLNNKQLLGDAESNIIFILAR